MIRRARRDGREARGNEEREKRGLRKGTIVSSSPQGSGYDKLELKHQNLVFFKLIECIIKKKDMSWCETVCKNMCHW